ncbi:hypothetical protein [Pseudofrankia sp. BMG5.36]|uniref:hypothetical protein n=1 Tax=Pseudofrankia sp. BMG5.36 TaxID=1834512 RepID=UPI0010424886|nr:hypothetical protein [Pseudofrankia sp. BMG5.36]
MSDRLESVKDVAVVVHIADRTRSGHASGDICLQASSDDRDDPYPDEVSMNDSTLAKQFAEDAGGAFVELIKCSGGPIRLQEIRETLVGVGISPEDVNRQWNRLRPFFRTHPHISKPKPALYEWSLVPGPSKLSLEALSAHASRRGLTWLIQAHVDNIADSLARAETAGPQAQIGWTEQREQEKAALVADIAGSAAMLAADGRSTPEIATLLAEETSRRRLAPIGHIGEIVLFNGDLHDPNGSTSPRAGQEVRVVRPGYSWTGGARSVVVAKALVAG